MSQVINWQSPSNRILPFGVYQHSDAWIDTSGIYMFCRQDSNSSYIPVYIGQTVNFRERLPRHEQWHPAKQKGASTVHAVVVLSQDDRDLFERQLIEQFQPILNTHHINTGLLGERISRNPNALAAPSLGFIGRLAQEAIRQKNALAAPLGLMARYDEK